MDDHLAKECASLIQLLRTKDNLNFEEWEIMKRIFDARCPLWANLLPPFIKDLIRISGSPLSITSSKLSSSASFKALLAAKASTSTKAGMGIC